MIIEEERKRAKTNQDKGGIMNERDKAGRQDDVIGKGNVLKRENG
jgi:hypothetical protein